MLTGNEPVSAANLKAVMAATATSLTSGTASSTRGKAQDYLFEVPLKLTGGGRLTSP